MTGFLIILALTSTLYILIMFGPWVWGFWEKKEYFNCASAVAITTWTIFLVWWGATR